MMLTMGTTCGSIDVKFAPGDAQFAAPAAWIATPSIAHHETGIPRITGTDCKLKSEIKMGADRVFAPSGVDRNVVRSEFFNAGLDLTAFFFMPILSF